MQPSPISFPCTGPHSSHLRPYHLVHNAGGASAWQWVTTGDPRAVAFLGRLLEETGIDESPALETATDHARFLLLRVVPACGGRTARTNWARLRWT